MYTTNLIIIEGGGVSRLYHAAAHGRLLIRSACVAVASRRQLHQAGIGIAACQPIIISSHKTRARRSVNEMTLMAGLRQLHIQLHSYSEQ